MDLEKEFEEKVSTVAVFIGTLPWTLLLSGRLLLVSNVSAQIKGMFPVIWALTWH